MQAIAALDHWVHSELYERAVALALQADAKRPDKFLRIDVPMSLLEELLHHSGDMEKVFRDHLRSLYGHLSFQKPDKIKYAFSFVSAEPLWEKVAKQLSVADGAGSRRNRPEPAHRRRRPAQPHRPLRRPGPRGSGTDADRRS